MNILSLIGNPKRVAQPVKKRAVLTNFLFTLCVMLCMNQAAGVEKDPNRCIDRVKVYVNDETQTFFSRMIINNLQLRLKDIESLSTAKLTEDQKQRKDKWVSPRIQEELLLDQETFQANNQQKEIVIRTSWKGGVKDLIFISREAKETELDKTSINLRLYRKNKRPRFFVTGAACSYKSSRRTTMIKATPEKTEGSKQNYHDLASFVAHQLIALSEVEGCNLGSEAKPLLVGITANEHVKPLPMGVRLESYEATASEEERHERITFPDQFPKQAAIGNAEIDVFNRPTDLAYVLDHPLRSGKRREVQVWKVSDDDICDLFDNQKVATQEEYQPITFDMSDDELDLAELEINLDAGSSYFQQHPNMAFKARWYSDDDKKRLVSESDLVKVGDQHLVGEKVSLNLQGNPNRLLPGTYIVELNWQKNEQVPAYKKITFRWRSTLNHNVGAARGLLGPKLLSMSGGLMGAGRIMENYYFQQRISSRFLRWESWPEEDAKDFADGILWHFSRTKELPYLSQWEGEQGIAAELVRALNMIVDDEDEILEQDAQVALDYLGKLPSMPVSFNKRELRSAMCSLSASLQEIGEATPLWMDCGD